jgi:hypothetical protein
MSCPGKVIGDGHSSVFSNIEDTGIPSLQAWCQQMTVSIREKAAIDFIQGLDSFFLGVGAYVSELHGVSESDRLALCKRWETKTVKSPRRKHRSRSSDSDSTYMGSGDPSDDEDKENITVVSHGMSVELKEVDFPRLRLRD